MFRFLMIVAILAMGGAVGSFMFACPCGMAPGGPLRGEAHMDPVGDWSFANEAPLCQIEIPSSIPYSINVNCMSANGALYVSCSLCAGKTWSGIVQKNPRGRVRIGSSVYAISFARIEGEEQLDAVWTARALKLVAMGQTNIGERPNHWWSFELKSQ
jgi:hypothetical protein